MNNYIKFLVKDSDDITVVLNSSTSFSYTESTAQATQFQISSTTENLRNLWKSLKQVGSNNITGIEIYSNGIKAQDIAVTNGDIDAINFGMEFTPDTINLGDYGFRNVVYLLFTSKFDLDNTPEV